MSMNKITLACSALFSLSMSGCVTAEDAGKAGECAAFLNNLPEETREAPTHFDLERSLNISSADQIAAVYDSILPLGSGCGAGEIIPADPEEIMFPWDAHSHVDIAAGTSGATPWIQFVYPSIGDFGPGLASSVVFYDRFGNPVATRLVSEYNSWENTSVLRSVMSQGTIESCRQQLEHFSYDQDGDIAGELESAIRSECERSTSSYPYP